MSDAVNTGRPIRDARRDLEDIANRKDDALAKWKYIKKIAKAVLATLPIQGENMSLVWGADGVQFNADQQNIDNFPFQVIVDSVDDTGAITISLWAATVSGIWVTLDGTNLQGDADDSWVPPTTTVTDGDYIWVKCTGEITAADGYLQEYDLSTAEIGSGSTVPDDDPSSGIYYRVLAQVVDGNPINVVRYSLEIAVCDDNTGEGTGNATFGVSG